MPARSPTRSVTREHDHARCVDGALAEAEALCVKRGVRLTALRRQTLELVWRAHRAVKAYDLLRSLGGKAGRTKPPTVYRALEFLLQQGLIHRIESRNAFVGCANPAEAHDSELLVCEVCDVVEELAVPGLGRTLADAAAGVGFAFARAVVEVRGRCARCRRSAVA